MYQTSAIIRTTKILFILPLVLKDTTYYRKLIHLNNKMPVHVTRMSQEVLELGTFEEIKDGVPVRFKVTTIPQKYTEEAVELMTKYFIPREPLCIYYKLLDDPEAVEAFRATWRKLINEGVSLMAVRDGPEDERERIIGVNVTYISRKEDEAEAEDSAKTEGLFEYLYKITYEMCIKSCNIYEKYGVDKYLSAIGLSVCSDYHGYKVGMRLLECRKPLCQALGIKITATIFTNPISIHLAEKVGFIHLNKQQFSDFRYKGERILQDMKNFYTYSAIEF